MLNDLTYVLRYSDYKTHTVRTLASYSPRSVTDKLQRVLNAAARLVSGTRKYDRGLSQILHADLHGSMWHWQIGSGTSLVLQSTDVSTTKRRSIWSTAAFQSQTGHRQSSATTFRTSLFADVTTPSTKHTRSAVGHSQSPDPLSGTCFQTNSDTPTALRLHSESH